MPLGELYAWDQSSHPFARVTRACFADVRRVDFLITTEAALERVEEWPRLSFWQGARGLFPRSPRVDVILALTFPQPRPGLMTDEAFWQMVNGFRFKGMLALTKVMLLEHGADVGLRDVGGRTALRWARLKGRQQPADLLMKAGASDRPDHPLTFSP